MSLSIYLWTGPENEDADFLRVVADRLEDAGDSMCERVRQIAERVSGDRRTYVYDANITHNLGRMAEEAGIYRHLWRSEELGITKAGELVEPLRAGVRKMVDAPDHYKMFNPENGWGSYDGFVKWLSELLVACDTWPNATLSISR